MSDHEASIRRTQVAIDRYAFQPRCPCGWAADWQPELSTAQRVADAHERTAE